MEQLDSLIRFIQRTSNVPKKEEGLKLANKIIEESEEKSSDLFTLSENQYGFDINQNNSVNDEFRISLEIVEQYQEEVESISSFSGSQSSSNIEELKRLAEQQLTEGRLVNKELFYQIQDLNQSYAKELALKMRSKIVQLINASIQNQITLWQSNEIRMTALDLVFNNIDRKYERKISELNVLLDKAYSQDFDDPFILLDELKEKDGEFLTQSLKEIEGHISRSENIAFALEQIETLSETAVQRIITLRFGPEFGFLGSGLYRLTNTFLKTANMIGYEENKSVYDPEVLKKSMDRVMQSEDWKQDFQETTQTYLTDKLGAALPEGLNKVVSSGMIYVGSDFISQVLGNLVAGKGPFDDFDPQSLFLSLAAGLAGGVLQVKLEHTKDLGEMQKLFMEAGYDGFAGLWQEWILAKRDGRELTPKDMIATFVQEFGGELTGGTISDKYRNTRAGNNPDLQLVGNEHTGKFMDERIPIDPKTRKDLNTEQHQSPQYKQDNSYSLNFVEDDSTVKNEISPGTKQSDTAPNTEQAGDISINERTKQQSTQANQQASSQEIQSLLDTNYIQKDLSQKDKEVIVAQIQSYLRYKPQKTALEIGKIFLQNGLINESNKSTIQSWLIDVSEGKAKLDGDIKLTLGLHGIQADSAASLEMDLKLAEGQNQNTATPDITQHETAFVNNGFTETGKQTQNSYQASNGQNRASIQSLNNEAASSIYKLNNLIVNSQRPQLAQHINSIMEEIINRNIYDEFLQQSNVKNKFTIHILDSTVTNAFNEISYNNIILTTEIIQNIYELTKNDQTRQLSFNDAIAFVIAHEISHAIYEQAGGDSNRKATSTGMEDYCDKRALEMMHQAGFNINSATFQWLQANWSPSIPIISTHSSHQEREINIKDIRENEMYSLRNYVSPLSENKIEQSIIDEIQENNTYDFLKDNDKHLRFGEPDGYIRHEEYLKLGNLNPRDCKTVKIGYAKALSLVHEFSTLNKWSTSNEFDAQSKISDYKQQITIALNAIENISESTKDMLMAILHTELDSRLAMRGIDVAIPSSFLPENGNPIDKLITFLEEIPSDIELQVQDFDYQGGIHYDLSTLFMNVIKQSPLISTEDYEKAFHLIDLVEKHEYYGNGPHDRRTHFVYLTYESQELFIQKLEELIKEGETEKVKALIEHSSNKLSKDDSEIVHKAFADPLEEYSFSELLNLLQNQRKETFHESNLIHSLDQVHGALGHLLSREKSNDEHRLFVERIDTINESIDNIYPDIEQEPNRISIRRRIANTFINSLIQLNTKLTDEHLIKAIEISPTVKLPESLITNIHYPNNFLLLAETILKRQSAEYIGTGRGNQDLYDRTRFNRDEKNIFLRRFKEILIEMGIPQTRSERYEYGYNGRYTIENTPGLGDAGDILPAVNTGQLVYGQSPQLQIKKIGEENYINMEGTNWLKQEILKVLDVKELKENPELLKTLIVVSSPEQQIALIELILEENSGTISEDLLLEYSPLLHINKSIEIRPAENSPKPSVLEAVGYSLDNRFPSHEISPRDYLFLKYCDVNMQYLQSKTETDFISWLEKYIPEASPYRDTLLNQVFSFERFTEINDIGLKQQILDMYKDKYKSLKLQDQFIEQLTESNLDLDEKIAILNNIIEGESEEKDKRLEEIFFRHGFKLNDIETKYKNLFSWNSLEYFKESRATKNWIYSYIQSEDNGSKVETLSWLTKKGEKPKKIQDIENYQGINFDELTELFTKARSFRQDLLKDVFTGEKGLFNDRDSLNNLLDRVFGNYFVNVDRKTAKEEFNTLKKDTRQVINNILWQVPRQVRRALREQIESVLYLDSFDEAKKQLSQIADQWGKYPRLLSNLSSIIDSLYKYPLTVRKDLHSRNVKNLDRFIQDQNGIREVVKEALHSVFDSESEIKKLRIINDLFKQVSQNPNMEFEDLVQTLLSSYGSSGVKLAQILSSQLEIKARFPELYIKLESLKDSNDPISLNHLLKAVQTNPFLNGKEIKILKIFGAASMKCVFLAEIDGERKVLKVRRINSDKNLKLEKGDFSHIVDVLSPVISQNFNIDNIPDYSLRVFQDIEEEAELTIEIENVRKMKKIVDSYNENHLDSLISFDIPIVSSDSNSVVMVEDIADGIPLKEWIKNANKSDQRRVEQELARFFIFSTSNPHNFIHADPHTGNFFVSEDNGKLKISLIDMGLSQQTTNLPNNLTNLVTNQPFINALLSVNPRDLELISKLASANQLKNINNINLHSPGQIILSFIKNPRLVWILLNTEVSHLPYLLLSGRTKYSLMLSLLRDNSLMNDLEILIDKIGEKKVIEIINKSEGKTLKEVSLILLNTLDSPDSLGVPQEMWRYLLAISKASYIVEEIKASPDILEELKN